MFKPLRHGNRNVQGILHCRDAQELHDHPSGNDQAPGGDVQLSQGAPCHPSYDERPPHNPLHQLQLEEGVAVPQHDSVLRGQTHVGRCLILHPKNPTRRQGRRVHARSTTRVSRVRSRTARYTAHGRAGTHRKVHLRMLSVFDKIQKNKNKKKQDVETRFFIGERL